MSEPVTVPPSGITEVRPVVPKRPEINGRIYWYGSRSGWIVKTHPGEYAMVPRGSSYHEVTIPSEDECAYLRERGELADQLIPLFRGSDGQNVDYQVICDCGAGIVREIDALDTAWAAKKREATDDSK